MERWFAAGFVLVVVVTACASAPGRAGSSPSGRYVATPRAVATSVPAVTAAPTTEPPRSATTAVPRCQPGSVSVFFVVQPPDAGQAADRTRALVVVSDVSAAPCLVGGVATLSALSKGASHQLAVHRIVPAGSASVVTVSTGASGFAGIEWTSGPGCLAIAGFELSLPGQHSDLPVDVVGAGSPMSPLDVCAGTVEIGPFSASADGSLSFSASGAGGS